MRALDAAVVTAFESGTAHLVTLVKIVFVGGEIICLNSSNWTISYGGDEYLGAAGLGAISPIEDRPGDLPGIQLELLRVDAEGIAIALDEEDKVQGSLITISTAILGGDPLAVLDVEVDWTGYGDVMSIAGEKIVLSVESKGVDLLRGNPLLYNDADQRSLYSTDRAFQYVNSQSDQNVIWPTKAWFTK